MNELDHLHIDLSGRHLIEASAGTGKTFAIAMLYLRILVEQRLEPDQILVVTYTEAATKELKGRIRARIREALSVFEGKIIDDPLLQGLYENVNGLWGERAEVRWLLDRGLKLFDTASIFTIHGFCRRVLLENAFESGFRYDTELITDHKPLLREIVDDFWRRSFFSPSSRMLRHLLESGVSSDSLWQFASRLAGNRGVRIIPQFDTAAIAAIETEALKFYQELQFLWKNKRNEIVGLISTDKGLKRAEKAYRADLLQGYFDQMDSFASAENPFDLPVDFERFCSSGIARGTKPTGIVPQHSFFDCCELLRHKVNERLQGFCAELIDFCNTELPVRKEQRNIRFFDDLLNDLSDALSSENGDMLAGKLRGSYRAALIDEFQDTDPVQYKIFDRIYESSKLPLFLIGDPKQAIYSFRGADIFAYMQAAKGMPEERRFTLTRNWRSTPLLLHAFNRIFSSERNPFIYEQIKYHPLVSGKITGTEFSAGSGSQAPMQVCLLPSDGLNVTEAQKIIPKLVSAEISRLLYEGLNGEALIGDKPVEPADIAVIVRSHYQAAKIRDALNLLGIPSVLRSDMTVFDTDEAVQLSQLIKALLEPWRETAVRSALVSDLFGLSGSDIASFFDDEAGWDNYLQRFHEYHQIWRDKGFMLMARLLLNREGVRGRLLKYPDGERRLTNLLHCLEIIHAREHESRAGIEALASWFNQRISSRQRNEEHEIRLETDEKAVKILTVHISKGLEYPIVFCPYLWNGIIEDDELISFHDDYNLVKDYGSADFETNRITARKELLAESLRLLYVAVTRARYRCYLYTGKVAGSGRNRPESSPLAWLFHASSSVSEETGDPVTALLEQYKGLSAEKIEEHLKAIAVESGSAISITKLNEDEKVYEWKFSEPVADQLICRKFRGTIRNDWRVASFTGFASHDPKRAELPDRDESAAEIEIERQKNNLADNSNSLNIFNFPKGARAGIFLHSLFEKLDFENCSGDTVYKAVQEALLQYGFDSEWQSCISDMICNLVSTSLPSSHKSFRLLDIRKGRWLTEFEFFFPLKFVKPESLGACLRSHGLSYTAADLDAVSSALQFRPVRGVVRGFMDLVFEYEGFYYLLDWKSNHLGYSVEDYGKEAIKREMERNLYPLQYLLYTVALNRFLAIRVPEYSYERSFGGVYYLFLRGMSGSQSEPFGIFHDIPPLRLIEDLTALLVESEGHV